MAEDDTERTEQATPRKRQQAREKGQLPRSRELTTFALLLIGIGGFWALSGGMMAGMGNLMTAGLALQPGDISDPSRMLPRLAELFSDGFMTVMPVLGLLFIAALVAPALIGGWNFSVEALQPDFKRLNPISGIARLFSVHSVFELVKAILKAALLGSIAGVVIWNSVDALLGLAQEPSLEQALTHSGHILGMVLLWMLLGIVLVVLIDVPFQIWSFEKKLRMAQHEIKQEHKETEGDPHVKGRIKSLQREMARRRMMAEVPKADVVVTNPTRYAVALRYQDGSDAAPRVVAKGTEAVAARIRELAEEHGIPLVEAPPLARALYRHVELEAQIPETLFAAVAEVMAYVYRLRLSHSGAIPAPDLPTTITVPPDMDPEARTLH